MWYEDVKKGFGLAIKNWRDRTGISQEELAWRAGLHRSYLADIERGARNASLKTIEKLAKALKVSLSTLFEPLGETEEMAEAARSNGEKGRAVDILLVEDEPRDVELTLAAFKEARMTNPVHVVRDGKEALDFVFCRGKYSQLKGTSRPQVMLLDLSIPKVNGLEVLRTLKADERGRKIRVVVLTVSRKDEDIQEAMRLGAEAYIVKPVDFRQFSEIAPQINFQWTLVQAMKGKRADASKPSGAGTPLLGK